MKTILHENNLNKIVKALLSLNICEVIDLGNDKLPKKKKYNEKSKICTYTWRENNKVSKVDYRKGQAKYYEEKEEKIRKYNLARYYEKKRKEKEQASKA